MAEQAAKQQSDHRRVDDLDDLTWTDLYRMPVTHPSTGAELIAKDSQPMWIDLIGSQSDELKELSKRFEEETRKLARKGKDITPERREAREVEILVTATKGWHLQVGGELIPCTRENAKDIYPRKGPAYVDIRRQVSVAVYTEDNFMGESKAA